MVSATYLLCFSQLVLAATAKPLFFHNHATAIIPAKRVGLAASNAFPLAYNNDDGLFYAQVQTSDQQAWTVLVDTGSPLTWLGANKNNPYAGTDNEVENAEALAYGDGTSFLGDIFEDVLSFGTASNLLAPKTFTVPLEIGQAGPTTEGSQTDGVKNFQEDGILGLGLFEVARFDFKDFSVLDSLGSVTNGISSKLFGLYFEPYVTGNRAGQANQGVGSLTFGEIDGSKTTTDPIYGNLIQQQGDATGWIINMDILYGDTLIAQSIPTLVDSGSNRISLPPLTFAHYMQQVHGGVPTTSPTLTESEYDSLQPLIFRVAGDNRALSLNANAQIFPRSLNAQKNMATDTISLVIDSQADEEDSSDSSSEESEAEAGSVDGSEESGLAYQAVLGMPFLQRFYSIYDATNRRVGFTETTYTNIDNLN